MAATESPEERDPAIDAMRRDARSDRQEIFELRDLLRKLDHTLTVHGKIDADTPLHHAISVARQPSR